MCGMHGISTQKQYSERNGGVGLRKNMDRIKNYLMNFMRGRYGIDQFSQALFIAALVCIVLAMFGGSMLMEFLGIGVFIYSYYRVLSRNLDARRSENAKYLETVAGIKRRFRPSGSDKENRVFICPNKACGQKIRVPRGKGKIEITCPKCKTKFVKRT